VHDAANLYVAHQSMPNVLSGKRWLLGRPTRRLKREHRLTSSVLKIEIGFRMVWRSGSMSNTPVLSFLSSRQKCCKLMGSQCAISNLYPFRQEFVNPTIISERSAIFVADNSAEPPAGELPFGLQSRRTERAVKRRKRLQTFQKSPKWSLRG
jgi:hypothetical protein